MRSGDAPRRVLIVVGVAGGASCAARLRSLDESVEIAVFDRGHYVSFANCGLPYYVGNIIADERTLLVASPQTFRERFNAAVHTETEVIAIDRRARTVSVREPDEFAAGHISERHQLAALTDALALRRAAQGSRHLDLLRCRTARVLRHAVPRAARVSIAQHVRRLSDVQSAQGCRPGVVSGGRQPALDATRRQAPGCICTDRHADEIAV
jgi:hypothetical protein